MNNREPGTASETWITRRFYFSASHCLRVAAWSDERNRTTFGRAVAPHGHNYTLEVSLCGPVDPTTGMIVNLGVVKASIGALIDAHYDHRDLSREHPKHRETPATTERVALVLAEEIAACLPAGIRLAHLRLWETENLFADVLP